MGDGNTAKTLSRQVSPPIPPGFEEMPAQTQGSALPIPEGFEEINSGAQPEQPGFGARLSERLGLTQHPLDQIESEAGQLSEHPGTTLVEALKNAGSAVTGIPRNADWSLEKLSHDIAHPVDAWREQQGPMGLLHPVQATGGPEFAEDVKNKNFSGAAGTLAGDVLPIAAMSPELRAGAGTALRGAVEAPGNLRDAIGARLHPGPEGALSPLAKTLSRAVTVGRMTDPELGPTLVDKLFPDPAGKAAMEAKAKMLIRRGKEQAALDAAAPKVPAELGTPENPGWHAPLPTRMPKAPPAEAITPMPEGATLSNLIRPGKTATAGLPNALPNGSPTLFSSTGPPVKLVDRLEAAENGRGRIVEPESAPPAAERTLQSYTRAELYEMAKRGDLAALRELRRSNAGLPLPPNSKFLLEGSGNGR